MPQDRAVGIIIAWYDTVLTDQDIYLFREGTHFRAYEKLGAHLVEAEAGQVAGTHFSVWAPNAASVSVVGSFNHWRPDSHPLHRARGFFGNLVRHSCRGVRRGALYKFHIVSKHKGYTGPEIRPVRIPLRDPASHRLGRLGPLL